MRRFNGYMHGIDIGGWLSQCDYSKEHLDNFITEEDIKRIKGWAATTLECLWIIISFRTKTAL